MIQHNKHEVRSRQLLYIIVATLVFEGILRKIAPGVLSIIIFFLKDFLCVTGLYFIITSKLTSVSKRIVKMVQVLIILLYPLLCYNIFFDPILLFWGGKLYLLYTVLAILMTMAFPSHAIDKFKIFLLFIIALLIPTVLLGLFQLTLPASHWLNSSVSGDSLKAFSAAGQLRISSTFSFTGQYSFFLTFATAIYFCNYFLKSSRKNIRLDHKLSSIILALLLFVGCFSTGGKSAVLGFFGTVVLGYIFVSLKYPAFIFKRLLFPVILVLFILPLIQIWKPEYFAAYIARSNSQGGSKEDIFRRVTEPFSNLNSSSIFGNGLGVMTNGSEKISTYAALIRDGGFWTETDFSTIIWEGGFYLVIVWYGFRLFLIFYSFRILFSIKNKNYLSASSFLFAYILIQGLVGTLTIQPPLAIYFWICFGALLCIQEFDKKLKNNNLSV